MLSERMHPDGLREVMLAAGRGNALRSGLLREIERSFDPGRNAPGPVLLTARGGSFCTGLDLVASFELDRAGMRELMAAFHRALRAVLLWPGPVVAAIGGHALAGGALLSLAADRRVMAHGPHRFGIHGVQLGVVYPQVAIEILRWRLERRLVERTLYSGRLRAGHEALREGLVDELVDPESLMARAGELARSLAAESRSGKSAVLAPVAARLAHIDLAGEESWLDQWFAPDTRQRLEAARAALLERRGPRPGELPDRAS